MRYAVFIILGLATTATQTFAYDMVRVEEYCDAQHPQNPTDAEWCRVMEKSAGELFDKALTADPTPRFKKRVLTCLKKHPKSYQEAMPCLTEIVDEIQGGDASSATSNYDPNIPGFDSKAYCNTVAQSVGGSYQIEKACRDQEASAWDHLRNRGLPSDIAKYCGEVARTVGGSYQIMDACADQEIAAKSALQ